MVAEASAASVVRDRHRERGLRQAAEEEATFTGVLRELAERRAPVAVRTALGRAHRGLVVALGQDFLVLRDAMVGGLPVFLPLRSVSTVRSVERIEGDVAGARPSPLETGLAALLTGLAGTRPQVTLVSTSGEVLTGSLRSAGVDVVTIRLDGGGSTHIPMAAVSEVTLRDV